MENIDILEFNFIGSEDRGYLIALEENKNIPFDIKRVYYTYNVPKGVKRGFHAHKNLEQVLVCLNGSIKVKCDYGTLEKTYVLDNPSKGLYIRNNVWREIYDYSEDAVLVVLASQLYSEDDYIRDYSEFIESISN